MLVALALMLNVAPLILCRPGNPRNLLIRVVFFGASISIVLVSSYLVGTDISPAIVQVAYYSYFAITTGMIWLVNRKTDRFDD